MNPLSKLLLVAALLVAVVGIGLAVVQPGDLGDSEAETAQPDVTEPDESSTSTSGPGDGTTTTTITAAGNDESTTTSTSATSAPPATTATTPTTAAGDVAPGGGSGLSGGDAAPADTEDGLANSGGTSLMAAALLVGLAGLAIRHRPTA